MYSHSIHMVAHDVYVQKLSKDHRDGRAQTEQVKRQINRFSNAVANLLNNLGNAFSANSSAKSMQPDPS